MDGVCGRRRGRKKKNCHDEVVCLYHSLSVVSVRLEDEVKNPVVVSDITTTTNVYIDELTNWMMLYTTFS